jgi:hypothetical protein
MPLADLAKLDYMPANYRFATYVGVSRNKSLCGDITSVPVRKSPYIRNTRVSKNEKSLFTEPQSAFIMERSFFIVELGRFLRVLDKRLAHHPTKVIICKTVALQVTYLDRKIPACSMQLSRVLTRVKQVPQCDVTSPEYIRRDLGGSTWLWFSEFLRVRMPL